MASDIIEILDYLLSNPIIMTLGILYCASFIVILFLIIYIFVRTFRRVRFNSRMFRGNRRR